MFVRVRRTGALVALAVLISLSGLGSATAATAATAATVPPDPGQPIPGCTLGYQSWPVGAPPVAVTALCQKIGSLTPLLAYPSLTDLTVNYFDYPGPGVPTIKDFTPLAKLVNLTSVGIGGVTDAGLRSIAALPKVTSVSIKGTFADLSPLADVAALQSVTLRSDNITDLKPLASLKSLSGITVAGSGLRSTADLGAMPGLRNLWLEIGPDAVTGRVRAGTPFKLPVFTGPDGVAVDTKPAPGLKLVKPGQAIFTQTGVSATQSIEWSRSEIISLPNSQGVSFSMQVVKNFDVMRSVSETPFGVIYGADRYATAVDISREGYPKTAPVVYLATGANYPDALVAGPAAAMEGGPLLLTPTNGLPASVKKEIQRLRPAKVVVVGGPAVVSLQVFNDVKKLVPNTVRRTGADRYEVARAVALGVTWKSSTAYVATGLAFPDALSAAAPAASQGSPVMLVRGTASAADPATKALLTKLGTKKVIIAGGPAAVSVALEKSLSAFGPVRVGGPDRYSVNRSLNSDLVKTATSAYFAAGATFPDALAGSALAGARHAPLYLVPRDCMPRGTFADLSNSLVEELTILGGRSNISERFQNNAVCR